MITEKQLFADLKAGRFKPVYLITGEVNYYIDLVSDYFENNIIDESFRDFDQAVFYGRDTDMTSVISAAKQYPMMSPVRLVLVKEAQDIDARTWEPLVGYLDNPQPQTILVFCYRHKSLDKRSKAYQAIAAKGEVYEHKKLYDNEVPKWIGEYVQQQGYAITERAAQLLAQYLGTDLGKIANEIGKVFIVTPKGATIDVAQIEENIGISKDYNVFELQNAIGRKDRALCMRIVNHFAANPKDNPIQVVLPTLYNFFIKIMIYHQLANKSDAATALKVNPFFVRDYAQAANNYPLAKLASCIGYLHEADLRSKGIRNSGNVTDGELIKELVFKIIH